MNNVGRRKFLQYCIASAAALGLERSVVNKLQAALIGDAAALPTVLWLAGTNCTGCTVSLANLVGSEPTDIGDLLINHIGVQYHPNLMGAAGDLAVQTLNSASSGPYVLAIEGGIPTAFGGHTCLLYTDNGYEYTATEAVSLLAPRAMAVLSIGTCASFGGIPAGDPNPTGIRSVREHTGLSAINIPGCPVHPDWIVWTIAQLLAGTMPSLDGDGRPKALFSTKVHDRCPRKGTEEAHTFGIEGQCLKELGCKGPETKADCPTRLWNGKTAWCIGANAQCLGCTERDFPDRFSPFFKTGEHDH